MKPARYDPTEPVSPDIRPWQQSLIDNLLALKQRQRLPHAILVEARSSQVGSAFIWHLAMSLLCEKVEQGAPCGICSSCRQMLLNSYPDFSFVTLEYDQKKEKFSSSIKIEQVRGLIREVFLTRRYDNLKIVAIYPAEKLSIGGANSLLKTLEEPSNHALIVLMSHNKGRIPVTVRSRCQIWSLDHPDPVAALGWLYQQGFNEQEAGQYLEYADGDPDLALKLKSDGYAEIILQFKQQFSLYLKNSIDVTRLCGELIKYSPDLIRHLVRRVIHAYCFQICGLQGDKKVNAVLNKKSAQRLLSLSNQAEYQLRVEENNLNLQLQLEDVLISLKQIIVRSSD